MYNWAQGPQIAPRECFDVDNTYAHHTGGCATASFGPLYIYIYKVSIGRPRDNLEWNTRDENPYNQGTLVVGGLFRGEGFDQLPD